MISAKELFSVTEQIAQFPGVQRIILFGSYAWGTADSESDIDLLVVMKYRGASYRAASRIRIELDAAFPMDILVRRPEEMESSKRRGDLFLEEIAEKGIVLHDSRNRGLGEEGRRRFRRRVHSETFAKA